MASDDTAHDVLFSIRIESIVQKPDCMDLDSEKLKLLSRRQREKRYRDSARMAKTFYYAFSLTKGEQPVKTDAFTFENPLWMHQQRLRVTTELLMQFYKKPLKFKVLERILTQSVRETKDTASVAPTKEKKDSPKKGKGDSKEKDTIGMPPRAPSRPGSVLEPESKLMTKLRAGSTANLRHGEPSVMHLNRPETPGSESNNGDDKQRDAMAFRDATRRRKQSISIELQHVGELLIDVHPLLMGELTTSAQLIGCIPGLEEAKVTVTVDEPLMSYWQAQQLNPLTVTVIRARNLPDNPGGYGDLDRRCLPVSYRYKLLGFAESKSSRGLAHAREVEWNERQLFLAGTFDQDEFREKLTSATFVVEIRDRDRRPPDAGIRPCIYGDGDAKAEEELAGGIARHTRQRIERDPFLGPAPPWDPHGVASFTLQNLLHGKDVLQMTSNILPCRAPPKRGHADPAQLPAGLYIEFGAELEIRVQLMYPFVEAYRPQKAFSRAVYMFNRGEDDLAARLEQLIVAINTSALHLDSLPTTVISAALSSYKLSREQKMSRTLNLVTGFQCVDTDGRIFVIEGLAAIAMERIWNAMLRAAEGRDKTREGSTSPVAGRSGSAGEQRMRQLVQIASRRFRVLYNPELTFGDRLYAAFDACIKTFRLSEPLDTLLTYPLLYVRGTVPHDCMAGLTKLHGMRQMHRLRDVVRLDLLPTAAMIVSVAKTVGMVVPDDEDAAFRAAMVLAERPKSETPFDAGRESSMRSSSASPSGRRKSSLFVSTLQDPVLNMNTDANRAVSMASRTGVTSVIDARNTEFEESIRQRGRLTADFVKENIARFPYCAPTPREIQGPNDEPVYIYSSQKYNTAEEQKKEIRQRIASDKKHIYTYSADFHSLSFVPVDIEEEKKQKEAQTKALWLTDDGFTSTLQRTTGELYRHPQRPDDARIDALREPWDESALHGQLTGHDRKPYTWEKRHEDFDAVGKRIVRLGEPQKSSVHLPGDLRRQEYKEYKTKEKADWESKVVVDDIDFKTLIVGSSEEAHKVAQIDKMKGLLKDPPMKLTLRGRFQAADPPPLALTTGGHTDNMRGPVHIAKDREPLDLTRHIS